MKVLQLFAFLVLCIALPFTSCNDDAKSKAQQEARESLPETNPSTTAAPPASTDPAAAAAANPEPHYKCPNNCVGGTGAAAGNCPACGTAMAHNQAFHNATNAISPEITTDGNTSTTITPPPTQEAAPAQNAAGVYHYTCAKGCAGGAAGAGNCASCGGALSHNQAYHN